MIVDGYNSEVADAQLDALDQGDDIDLYNAVLDACELVFRAPAGIRLLLPVPGHPPVKVFWSSEGPRIEAALPHP